MARKEFDKNMSGSKYTIAQGKNSLTVLSQGAKIEALVFDGINILANTTRGDGKPGITHPCTPNFGLPEGAKKYGLMQHGPMRNDEVELVNKTDSSLEFRYEVKLPEYPLGLVVLRKFELTDTSLTVIVVHKNTGTKPIPVAYGEHLYFNAPQGIDGVLVNGENIADKARADTAFPWQEKNILEIPGLPVLEINQKNLNFVNVWVGKNLAGEFDSRYICVEPIEADQHSDYFGSEASMILPNEQRAVQFTIRSKMVE